MQSVYPRARHNPNQLHELNFKEYLSEKGLAETTIEAKLLLIRYLEKHFNLWDSEAIKEHIRTVVCCKRRKNNIGYAYRDWCRWKGSEYEHEYLKENEAKLPYIQTERELDHFGSPVLLIRPACPLFSYIW